MGAIIAAISRLCCCSDEPEPTRGAGDFDSVGVELASLMGSRRDAPVTDVDDDSATAPICAADFMSTRFPPGSSGHDDNDSFEANSLDNPSKYRSVSSEQLTDHPGELEHVRSVSSPGDIDKIEFASSMRPRRYKPVTDDYEYYATSPICAADFMSTRFSSGSSSHDYRDSTHIHTSTHTHSRTEIEANSTDNPSELRSVSSEQLTDHPGELEYVRSVSSPGNNDKIEANSLDNTSECRSVSSEQLTVHPGELEHVCSVSSPDDNDMLAADHIGANSPESFAECLTISREQIVGKLEELDDILGYLVLNHAISEGQIDVIMTQKKGRNKVRELLDCVHRRGEEACRSLVAALRDTEQIELCQLSASIKLELDQEPVRDVLSIDQYMTEMKCTYQQKIENRNEQEQTQYGNSISLDQHVPVIINHGHAAPDGQTRQGFNEFNIQKTDRKQLTLDGIFLTDTDRRRPHSVLMLGGPGMGKTSLCFTILNRFACGQWVGGHHFIFLLLLKELGDMGLSLSLADLLFDYTFTGQTKTQKRKLIRQLQNRQDRILLIMDGYDEHDEFMTDTLIISDPSAKAHPGVILRSLVRGALLPKSQILLTSRPFHHVDMNVDRVVELAGLTNHSVRTLLGKFLVGELKSAAEFLDNHPDVASMLSIPINIQKFISYLSWIRGNTEDILSNLPKTKSSLYSKQMLPVLTQCLRSKDILLYEEHRIWRHPLIKSFLCKLAKLAVLAFKVFGKKQIIFEASDLERCELTEKDVKTSGLMSIFTKQTKTPFGVRPVVFFYFNHLTTLEWCGGLDTASRDIKYIENLIKRNDGNLDVVLIFCAGLLGATEGQLILKRLYGILKHECQQKALSVLNQIVYSDRCCKPGGPQFAIEVFSEASFVDPRPLLPLLAPEGKTLEIAGIALSNRQAVDYFVEQLNSSQDEQTGATGTHGSEIGLDTVRLHFTEVADRTVQNSMVAEVAKLKKLKHLLINTDGYCEVVERQLDMLLIHGRMSEDCAKRVIETSRASTLCLFSHDGCFLPESMPLSQDGQEIHLGGVIPHKHMVRSMVSKSSLHAVPGLEYRDDTAAVIRRVIEETPTLKALGLMLNTDDDEDCSALSSVVSASSVACLSLCVDPYDVRHMEVIKQVLLNASSLRELWLVFFSTPSDTVLVDLARWVCQHDLIRLSLVCLYDYPINVTRFLQLVKKPHSIRHIYTTDDVRSVDPDVVRRFTDDLRQVRGGLEGAFFAPLVYSDYLLTSIPSHVKEVLTRRYVSPY